MAFEHVEAAVFGVQFHPESVGTPMGHQVLENFLATSIGLINRG
jgi:anthranilate synthase component 2